MSRETELTQTPPSLPSTPSSPSSPESLPKSPFQIRKKIGRNDSKPKKARQEAVMLSIGDGIDDSYIFRSPSVSLELPHHLSAPTPPSPIYRPATPPTSTSTSTQTTPTHKEPTTFSIQHSLQAISKQLTISNTRLSEMGRIITSQGNIIKELVSKQKSQHVTPLPLTPVPPSMQSTPTTPRFHPGLPDLPLTPTTTQLIDSPLSQPLTVTPTSHRRTFPVHLFDDLPESVRLSEDDLSRLSCCGNTPGAFGVLLLKHFYPEQLRVYYSYRGGGKLSKRPLDDSRKTIIKRYVVALFPSVNTESAYHAMVVVKINQYLCRPVQPAQKV
ncbi:unnamed protein product [Mytilus coruscus]|uniref:BEN domain-containing protein n=1 Tax=Mytilus coruscus TaxID=42192 RepID=A0A6J8AVX7_MYTCO|nr:unnamed protein product [Mytilus coruscus]